MTPMIICFIRKTVRICGNINRANKLSKNAYGNLEEVRSRQKYDD